MILVRWEDAAYYAEGDKDEQYSLQRLETLGFLVSDTTDVLVLASELSLEDASLRHIHVIPKERVLSITALEGEK